VLLYQKQQEQVGFTLLAAVVVNKVVVVTESLPKAVPLKERGKEDEKGRRPE
jgi:hypothetical protein